jgi:type IV pilus assembly protein PilM
LRFIRKSRVQHNRVLAIALGSHTTKAVALEREGSGYVLRGFTIQDTPVREGKDPAAYAELLTGFFRKIKQALGGQISEAIIVLGYAETLLRHVELPVLPIADLREMLELGSKTYLQEDHSDFSFDCWVPHGQAPENAKPGQKSKVLVGGVKRATRDELHHAARNAGLNVLRITVSQIGQASAVRALLGLAEGEAVATLDVGFRSSSICILADGEIVQSRVVALGGDKLTRGLAEAMNVSYAAAEGVKLVLPDKVQATLKELLSSLAAELKGSIDFFEAECGKKVTAVYVSGGSARSNLILQTLHESVALPFKHLDPTTSITLAVPEGQVQEVKREAPQLTVAIGAGLNLLDAKLPVINFLAKQQEEEEERRQDPLRPSLRAAAFLIALMVVWSISLALDLRHAGQEIKGTQTQMENIQKVVDEVTADSKTIVALSRQYADLMEHASNRFLWAGPLNAMQQSMVNDVALTRLSVDQYLTYVEPAAAPAPGRKRNPADRGKTLENITLTILAKDFASPGATEKFIENLVSNPYFRSHLRNAAPVTLKNRVARQVDTADPTQSFVQITIECVYKERVLGYDE